MAQAIYHWRTEYKLLILIISNKSSKNICKYIFSMLNYFFHPGDRGGVLNCKFLIMDSLITMYNV